MITCCRCKALPLVIRDGRIWCARHAPLTTAELIILLGLKEARR